MIAYTTTGSVRGSCGHQHKTHEAALECLLADHAACVRRGGYSDRRIVRIEDGDEIPMTEAEEKATPHGADEALAAIAKRRFGWGLATQNSDRLDFHEVAVWTMRDALREAFEAGARAATPLNPPIRRSTP